MGSQRLAATIALPAGIASITWMPCDYVCKRQRRLSKRNPYAVMDGLVPTIKAPVWTARGLARFFGLKMRAWTPAVQRAHPR